VHDLFAERRRDMNGKTAGYLRSAALAFVIALSLFVSCLFGPDDHENRKKSEPVPTCKPLTDKDNIFYNLELAYKTADLGCYLDLLTDSFTFHLQEYDVVHNHLPEYWTRAQDSTHTRNLFLAAKRQHPDTTKNIDRLEFVVENGSWVEIEELGGQPCEDCWQTTREYFLTIVLHGGHTTLYGSDLAQFTVVPVMEGGKKLYKLARIDDIQKPSGRRTDRPDALSARL
jgi:hypothetical protein